MNEFPEVLDAAAWRPVDLGRFENWRRTLTDSELEGLLSLCGETDEEKLPANPVPSVLAPEIAKIGDELKAGLGFRILRGLPVNGLGREGSAVAFMVLSRLLGRPMPQPGGVRLAHVRSEPESQGKGRFGFRVTDELPFHADLEDVIGFLCIAPASKGGTRKFASAATVYNVMREDYADQLRVLTQPFYMALQSPHPDHGHMWTRLPFLSVQNGLFNACTYRVHIKRAQRLCGVPELTPAQKRALAVFNDVADNVAVSLELERGDIEYFNNHVVLHTRTRFSDDHGPGRHLLRVWLSVDGFRDLHPEHPIRLRAGIRP